MVFMLQAVSPVAITLVAVVGMALRIEHRLTKIETDVTWLKARMKNNPGKKEIKVTPGKGVLK